MILTSSVGVFVAGLLRLWWNLQRMVALPLIGLFDEFAKIADSDANPGAGNRRGRSDLGAAMLVAGLRWVTETIIN